MPSGFTIANLFFGVWAIVSASRNEFDRAGLYIVLGGVCDALDGRVARATRTGSRFGEELDSLVDAITFGLAPAMIMYFAVLNREGTDWVWAFGFVACAVIRLARFNVEQAGRAKTHFYGLPSPAAGMTLATYYWFRESALYQTPLLADLPWPVMLRFIMLGLAFLMISNVRYAAVPTIGYRSIREILGTLLVIGTLAGMIFIPKTYFFPAAMAYVLYGVVRTVFVGFLDRRHIAEIEDDVGDPDALDRGLHRRRRKRRRGRPGQPSPTDREVPKA